MKTLLKTSSIALLAITIYFGMQLHHVAMERTEIKVAYSELNSFTYGLLSADAWKAIMRKIVIGRINDFQFTEDQQNVLEKQTAKVLDRLLIEAENVTRKNKNTLGMIKTHFAKSYIKTARQNVTKFAGTINDQIKDPKTMQQLKKMALEQFDAFASSTQSDPEDIRKFNRLLAQHNTKSVEEFNVMAKQQIAELDASSRYYSGLIMTVVVLFMAGWAYVLKQPELHRPFFLLSATLGLTLLLTSLSIPMMEIDARLHSVDLKLIGEPVHFDEQVIYYRSKSLMQVVWLLATSGKMNSLAVGFLLILFSVLFPMAKLITSVLYLRGNDRFNNSKFVQFFALKSGKWSMADVMVIAIFMSYIGFESILSTQLPKLNRNTKMFQSITTDASSLQAGFILFLTFVLYNLGLSEMLKRITKSSTHQPQLNDLLPVRLPKIDPEVTLTPSKSIN